MHTHERKLFVIFLETWVSSLPNVTQLHPLSYVTTELPILSLCYTSGLY